MVGNAQTGSRDDSKVKEQQAKAKAELEQNERVTTGEEPLPKSLKVKAHFDMVPPERQEPAGVDIAAYALDSDDKAIGGKKFEADEETGELTVNLTGSRVLLVAVVRDYQKNNQTLTGLRSAKIVIKSGDDVFYTQNIGGGLEGDSTVLGEFVKQDGKDWLYREINAPRGGGFTQLDSEYGVRADKAEKAETAKKK